MDLTSLKVNAVVIQHSEQDLYYKLFPERRRHSSAGFQGSGGISKLASPLASPQYQVPYIYAPGILQCQAQDQYFFLREVRVSSEKYAFV